jgi:hypothetical protein
MLTCQHALVQHRVLTLYSPAFQSIMSSSRSFLRHRPIHTYIDTYATTSPQTIPTMLVIWRSSQLPFRFESVSKMSNKRSSRPRSSAESEATKPVSIVREMEEIQVDHPHTGSIKSETPKAIKLGIDLARKLFHRPHDEQLDTSIRVDRIFYVHTTNEQHELRRRATEEDLDSERSSTSQDRSSHLHLPM